MDLPTYADIERAADLVHRHIRPTPLYEWPALSKLLGCRYLLKHENHTPTTAFKVRGGVYLVSRLSDDQKRRGIITCSTGNHGQSMAYGCRLFEVPCVVVVPEGNNPEKNAAIRALGAEVIEHGQDFDEARAHCEAIREQRAPRYVHSANEPDLIAGVGTYALEIFEEVPKPDAVIVPVGLGSGICGTALVAAARRPETRVIGVQSELAPAQALSWRSGQMVETSTPRTFAEGVATRVPASMTMSIMRRLVHDMILVSEEALRRTIRLLLTVTHNLAEGAGAAATAAAFEIRERLAGKTVVGILSGGNLDSRILPDILRPFRPDAAGAPAKMPPLPRPLEACIFDLDGTLVDSYTAITASVNFVRAAHGLLPLPEPEVRKAVGRGAAYLIEHTVPGADLETDLARYRAHHPSVIRPGTHVLPHAREALQALKGFGIKIGICSNKPIAFTKQLLEDFDLSRFAVAVVGPEDAARPKPAPDMLQVALRRLNVDAAHALYVGDMTVDIETARAAGVAVCVVPTGSNDRSTLAAAGPDRLLRDLGDLPNLVQTLLRA